MGYHVRITGQCNRANIEEARKLVESQFKAAFTQDENDFEGGVYFRFGSSLMSAKLFKNRDLTDEPLYEEFPAGCILLTISFLDAKEHARFKPAIENCDLAGTVVEDISD
jgi:hypothetical protein